MSKGIRRDENKNCKCLLRIKIHTKIKMGKE